MTEAKAAVDLEPWREPVDARIEMLRTLLPGAWERYCVIATELEPPGFAIGSAIGEAAARKRLLIPLQSKLPETGWRRWRGIRGPLLPEEVERYIRRADLVEEGLELERKFQDAIMEELRSGRWEGEDLVGPIPDRMWSIPQLRFDWRNAMTQLGAEVPRYGLRLRPRQPGEVPLEPPPAQQPVDPDKKLEPVEPVLIDSDGRRYTVCPATSRVRGRIKKQRRAWGPLIKVEYRRGLDVSVTATALRLQTEGRLTLPGNGEEENLRRELIRDIEEIWDEIEILSVEVLT